MDDDRTRRRVRDLLTGIDRHGGKVPIGDLIDMADDAERRVTIDRSEDPPIVYVEPTRSPRFDTLSAREMEVAALVASGRTNRQIASALFISLGTAKDHVHAVLTKTGLDNRAAVAGAWHGADDG